MDCYVIDILAFNKLNGFGELAGPHKYPTCQIKIQRFVTQPHGNNQLVAHGYLQCHSKWNL